MLVMSFYVYLPWNGSPNYFENNSTADFKIKLPKVIKSKHKQKLEVSLIEIHNLPLLELPSIYQSMNTMNTIYKAPHKEQVCSSYFILCDIVEPQIYGSTYMNLLRLVNVYDESVKHICFESPMFVPVSRTEFDTVHVKICDSKGETVKLRSSESENLTLTLHFRERNQFE